MASASVHYRYRALDPSRNEIRLLRIHPSQSPGDLVHCSLGHYSLDSFSGAEDEAEFSDKHQLKAWVAAHEAQAATSGPSFAIRQAAATGYAMRSSFHSAVRSLESLNPMSGPGFKPKGLKGLKPDWESSKIMKRLSAAGNKLKGRAEKGDGTGLVSDLLSGSLFSLPAAPDSSFAPHAKIFYALSYTWGSPHDTRPVIVDGVEVLVGANLEGALRAFRDDPEGRFLPLDVAGLWADQLCINQADAAEKSDQVSRMGALYKVAWRVIVWLGPRADDSDDAIETLYRLFANSVDWVGRSEYRMRSDVRRVLSEDAGAGTARAEAVDAFFSRPYFQRLWVLQELAARQSNAMMACGGRSLPWRLVEQAAHLVSKAYTLGLGSQEGGDSQIGATDAHLGPTADQRGERPFDADEDGDDEDDEDEHGIVSSLAQTGIRRVVAISTTLQQRRLSALDCLRSALYLGTSSKCMDDRDRIYGILALLPGDMASDVQTDYGISAAEVYERFSRTAIHCTKSLDFIHMGICHDGDRNEIILGDSGSHRDAEVSSLPTWVQDWRVSRRRLMGSFTRGRTAVQAALGTPADVMFLPGHILACRGVLFDSISCHDGAAEASIDGQPAYAAMHIKPPLADCSVVGAKASLQRSLAMLNPAYLSKWREGQTVLDIPWPEAPHLQQRTTSPAWSALFPSLSPTTLRAFDDFRVLHAGLIVNPDGRTFRDLFPSSTAEAHGLISDRTGLAHSAMARKLVSSVPYLSGRKLVRTKHRFVAFAPKEAVPGDVITVLAGSSYPVLLRPSQSAATDGVASYKVVGEIYVDGIMGGEVMDLVKSGVCSLQELVLR